MSKQPKLEEQRDGFQSKWGFILACIDSAVGMGNIWRFPIIGALMLILTGYADHHKIARSKTQPKNKAVSSFRCPSIAALAAKADSFVMFPLKFLVGSHKKTETILSQIPLVICFI